MFKTSVSFAANFAVHPVRTDLILRFANVLSLNERNTHGNRLEFVVQLFSQFRRTFHKIEVK